jgi:hypothetical protein
LKDTTSFSQSKPGNDAIKEFLFFKQLISIKIIAGAKLELGD